MSSINNINSQSLSTRIDTTAPIRGRRTPDALEAITVEPKRTDSVEISSEARNAENSRADLIARVRAEIAAGIYETDARIDGTVDGILNDLA